MGKEILNFYEFVEDNLNFRQFKVDEILFTAYDCPLEESPLDYWTQKNYFCYIIKGGLKWKTTKQEYIVQVGDALFIQKGAHRVYKIGNGEFCALLIFMPDEFVREAIEKELSKVKLIGATEPVDSVIPLSLDQSLSDYFNTVLRYFSQPAPPSKSLLELKFKELIVNLVTNNYNPDVTRYFKEICCVKKRAIKAIMEENFTYNLRLEDYANLCGRSLASYKRDFQKIYGTTPGKWLRNKRLEYGKFLLETTELNINEITLDTGFENTSHFVKAFKGRYHNPPLKFRKLLKHN
jgi:AraC family transcriptional regulator, exoenzyme S synthesis regulatory protein ExsA